MDDLRRTIETVVDAPVRFNETGYGYSCHVADAAATCGTSFAAVDVDRKVPHVYFDAGSARGRSAVADAQRRTSVAYVVERLLTEPDRVATLLATHPDRYRDRPVADGGARTLPGTSTSGTRGDFEWIREALRKRCQYLHGRGLRNGPHTTILDEFERDPLTNDKLGQQFGWRIAASERDPDVPLELLLMESHAQVAAVHAE